jgi:sugar transferase (PEP-CTERM/EpsH1 system associated)
MKILYVPHRMPWPPLKGDKIRSWRWIEALAGEHEIYLGTLAESEDELRAGDEIRDRLAGLAAFRRPARARAGLALFTGRTLSEEVFRSGPLLDWVKKTYAEVKPDLALGFSSTTAQYIDDLPIPRVMDLVDVDSAKWERYAEAHFPRLLWRTEARRLRAKEEEILKRYARVTVVSGAEADRLPATPGVLEVVPNGVDTEYFQPGDPAKERAGEIVFTGAMDYTPNVDAVVWFVNEILPRIRETVADASFTIVGSNPLPEVRDLAGTPGVTVTGTVPDIRPYLEAAQISVAPLLIAMGVQNKVLEAMAAGLPVVATPVGAIPEAIRDGVEGLLVPPRDAEALAAALGSLVRDRARRASLGRAARARAESEFGVEAVVGRLEALWADLGAR